SFLLPLHPERSLFPYTTLFRSRALVSLVAGLGEEDAVVPDDRRGVAFVGQIDLPADVLLGGPLERQTALGALPIARRPAPRRPVDRKITRLNSSHVAISYAVFC